MTKLIVDACVLINCFQRPAEQRSVSIDFVERMLKAGKQFTMPAHGWFEVLCNLNRLSDIDRTFLPPVFQGGMQLPLELIHIDDHFIRKYGNVALPYTKASDHIYLVIAQVNAYPIVTTDKPMGALAKDLGIQVFSPAEYEM